MIYADDDESLVEAEVRFSVSKLCWLILNDIIFI